MTLNGRMTVTTAVACVLASTALLPLFSSSLWFAMAGGAVITVAAAGALTRLRPLPAPACLAGSVAGLLLYLNLVFEARHSLLFVIPTPGSLSRLWDLAGTGMDEANRYAPPVPNLPGLLLLAAGGVGITAVLADLIAVRLRSTALAGLPLLVLFTVPVMMNASHDQLVTGLVFCAGRGGVPGHAQRRRTGTDPGLGPPGLVVAPGTAAGVRPGHPGAGRGGPAGRAGLDRAGAVRAAAPARPAPEQAVLLGPGHRRPRRRKRGLSLSLPSALAETVTQLREPRPSTVFTYTTSASQAQQDNDAEYFGQYVFDNLTEGGWEVNDYSAHTVPTDSIPADPQGLADAALAHTVTTTATVSQDFPSPGSQPTFLPLPYPAIHVYAPGKWVADPDLMVYSTSDSIAGRSYSVVSVAVDPNQAQLESVPGLVKTAILAPDLQLPSSYRDGGAEERGGQLHGRTDQRIRQGGRAGELALGRAVQLQPHRGAVEQRGEPAELPDQDEERLLRAVRLRDDRADPPARLPGPVRGRLHGGHAAQERQLRGQEHRRARVDRGVLPGLWLDPLRAHAGRPGHRDPPELHDQRDGVGSVRRDLPDPRGDRRAGQQQDRPARQRGQPDSPGDWCRGGGGGFGGRPGRDPVDSGSPGGHRRARVRLRPDHPHRPARPARPRRPPANPPAASP